jgi:2-amino-4-hydroxy-6-hydroxymethyldihydropteridine diphosphokinase
VVMLQTDMPPQTILKKILEIEIVLGRRREEKWGSRTIDIDILFYAEHVINEPGLQVPHPELHKRRFTLEPLNEIAPEFMHPGLKKTIFQLINELTDDLIVKKIYF